MKSLLYIVLLISFNPVYANGLKTKCDNYHLKYFTRMPKTLNTCSKKHLKCIREQYKIQSKNKNIVDYDINFEGVFMYCYEILWR